jgi:hypothetical protein
VFAIKKSHGAGVLRPKFVSQILEKTGRGHNSYFWLLLPETQQLVGCDTTQPNGLLPP